MANSNYKVISLIYELHINGEMIEKTDAGKPFSFLAGASNVLPKFEENLINLKQDETFDFNLAVDEAYGQVKQEAIVNVPRSAFEAEGQSSEKLLVVGQNIPMQDTDGNRLNGIVTEVEKEFVKMDFNHPLAGNDLHFKGTIIDIREATEDEIQHGHIHDDHSCEDCSNPECHSKCEH